MKRVLGLILALALCMVLFPAVAELGSVFSQDQIDVDLSSVSDLPEVKLNPEAKAGNTADAVVNSNGVYSITTPSGMGIKFDPRGLTYMTLTQSYYASYDVYGLFNTTSAANDYINKMVSGDIHVIVWDTYDAFQLILMDTLGSDDLTKHVGNLAYLNTESIKAVASALASAANLKEYSLYSFNGNVWIQLGANNLFTIVNSEYAHVQYIPNGNSMTKEDYSDFTDFMRSLMLY